MRIRRLSVNGFRQFDNQQAFLEPGTTILAGANNSGKTSLIDLLRMVLKSGTDFSLEDFSAVNRLHWSNQLIEALFADEMDFDELISDKNIEKLAPKIEVHLEIEYDPDLDDIREYADYLMDLDLSENSFYFLYRFAPEADKLRASLIKQLESLQNRIGKLKWTSFSEAEADPLATRDLRSLRALLGRVHFESCITEVFYSDSTFTHCMPMEKSRFYDLFHFELIKASRPLDDTVDDKTGALTRTLINAMKGSDYWNEAIDKLPGSVVEAIESAKIDEVAAEAAVRSLNETVAAISATNGEEKSELFLDFELSEDGATSVIQRAMQARYLGGGVPLGEKSQGLGYSNLVVLHLELEAFLKNAQKPENSFLVNLVLVEEPESHMHPQMQNVFIKHLFHRVEELRYVQALVTTHSSEIVRSSAIEQLRVLKVSQGHSEIIDLREFHSTNVTTRPPEEQRLFSLLYDINFADVLFADKVVMYEGDTERMYLQALIKDAPELARLRSQYVSYVQVGGAHAHIYVPLIVDTLKIRTVIITDLDYEKDSKASNPGKVLELKTTNSTLKSLFQLEGPLKEGKSVQKPLTVADLFVAKNNSFGLAFPRRHSNLAVSFQAEDEGYARTLEEAILSRYNHLKVWTRKPRKWWAEVRENSELNFSIPSGKKHITTRQIVTSTSAGKTDFMYSLILKENFHDHAPAYVRDALQWLAHE